MTAIPVHTPRRLFTVHEFYRMADAGIFQEDDRVELLAGEIVEMTPIGSRHAACVGQLNRLLHKLLTDDVFVRVQDPIRLDDYSEPQPDIVIVRTRSDFYRTAHPTAADVLLVIEVADASADTDRSVKVPLYASARIPETWIVDLNGRVIDVYRRPDVNGYKEHLRLASGADLTAAQIADLTVSVSEVLG
jgi:Uma2 family endonuclease